MVAICRDGAWESKRLDTDPDSNHSESELQNHMRLYASLDPFPSEPESDATIPIQTLFTPMKHVHQGMT